QNGQGHGRVVGVFHEAGRRRWTPILVALGVVVVASGIAAAASLLQNPKQRAQPVPSPPAGAVSVTALRVPPSNRPLLGFRDESRHMCAVRNSAGDSVDRKADLKLMDAATGKARQVASVLTTQDRQVTGAWTLLSCSTKADRAVVVFTHDAVRALRVLQLSTG